MFSDIRHQDGSYEFRLHVPPDRLDPDTATEVLSVLRALVREIQPLARPSHPAVRVLAAGPSVAKRSGRRKLGGPATAAVGRTKTAAPVRSATSGDGERGAAGTSERGERRPAATSDREALPAAAGPPA